MIKKFVVALLVGLAIVAAVQSAQAGVVGIPGTENALRLIGANDRGDILWIDRSDIGLHLSSKDASGIYTHISIDATVPGKGTSYASFANNGDAVWLGNESVNHMNMYYYDATTRTARQLTFYVGGWPMPDSGVATGTPQISDHGNALWAVYYPLGGYGGTHFDYFDKSTNQIIRLTATSHGKAYTINRRGDAYWFEPASDGVLDLRKFDVVTRATSIVTRRPAGTGIPSDGLNLAANDFGDIVWTEVVAGTSQTDVFLFDASANAVLRVTNTPGRKYTARINTVGDIVWLNESQAWLYGKDAVNAVLIGGNSAFLALNDMGEVAWSASGPIHLYKRATAGDVMVNPGVYTSDWYQALTGSGDLYYVSRWGTDLKQGQIMRATRGFTCN